MNVTAPDGIDITVSLDVELPEDQMCTAERPGGGFVPLCTLPAGHPGPWHVATTDTSIIAVWPVT
jgi:hypothetical protein